MTSRYAQYNTRVLCRHFARTHLPLPFAGQLLHGRLVLAPELCQLKPLLLRQLGAQGRRRRRLAGFHLALQAAHTGRVL